MAAKALNGILDRLRGARGRAGEDLACAHLVAQGLQILARNYRCRSGEVDIVARHGATTVFVEVKDRRGPSHGEGFEAVTFGKRRRIIRAARLFASSQGLSEALIRFDVVSIDRSLPGPPRVRHDPGAFDADGR